MEKARILIVEDESIIAMELESQLQRLGYQVTSVVDTCEKAIDKAEEDKPDLILMDIRIKGEMDGIDTAEVIRNKFDIPVIFSTAYLDKERIERAKITMPFGYVLKPIQERDLKVTVEMALYVAKVDCERKKVAKALKDSEAQKRAILNGISTNIAFVDKNLGILWANTTAAESVNKSPEELTGKRCYELWADPKKVCENCPTIRAFQTRKSEHTIMHTPGGRIWDEVGEPVFDTEGNLLGVVEIAQDITEQIKTAESLQKSEEKYRTLFENSPYGVFLVDNNAKYIEVNDAACEMTGYSEEELLCLSIPDVSSSDEETRSQDMKPFLDIQSTGKGEGIIHLKHKDGSIFKANLKGVKIDDNSVVGICEKLKD
jgi:PAS domain S-box-containing protein